MAYAAAAGWAVGGLIVKLMAARPEAQQPEAEEPDEPAHSPQSPGSSEAASQWLVARATPSFIGSHPLHGTEGLQLLAAPARQRPLPAGALVCLLSPAGEMLVAQEEGGAWSLQAVPTAAQEGPAPAFLPACAVFVVVRSGSDTGFRSCSADGRLLQAVRGAGAPHRLGGLKLGSWERWALAAEGFVNAKHHKALGWEAREVRCLLKEDLWRAERRQLQERVGLEQQACLAVQRQRELEELLAAAGAGSSEGGSEGPAELRQRLTELQQHCHRLRISLAQRAQAAAQLEHRLADLAGEQQALTMALEEASLRASGAEADLLALRAQAERARGLREQAHARELDALRSEQAAAAEQREAAATGLVRQLEHRLQQQAEQLQAACEERDRLDIALQSISGQMEREPQAQPEAWHSPAAVDAPKIRELRRALAAQGLNTGEGLIPAAVFPPDAAEQPRDGSAPADASPAEAAAIPANSEQAPEAGTGAAAEPPAAAEGEQLQLSPLSQHEAAAERRASLSGGFQPLGFGGGSAKLMQLLSSEHSPPG